MAPRKRKKPVKKVKFQLTRSGIAGIAVVCFCVFLWMFILGVWAGQFLLFPPVSKVELSSLRDSGQGKQVLDVIQIEAKKKKIIKNR
jgi:hypothetical protein